MAYGVLIILALVLAVVAAIVTIFGARKSGSDPGGVHPPGDPPSRRP